MSYLKVFTCVTSGLCLQVRYDAVSMVYGCKSFVPIHLLRFVCLFVKLGLLRYEYPVFYLYLLSNNVIYFLESNMSVVKVAFEWMTIAWKLIATTTKECCDLGFV